MQKGFAAFFLAAFVIFGALSPAHSTEKGVQKAHDFIPRVHNIIFLVDVSDSMTVGYPAQYDPVRLFIGARGLKLFNQMMPPVPQWQYDLNTAIITFGDCEAPRLVSVLGPWNRGKYDPVYSCLRHPYGPYRTAGMQEGIQLAGQLIGKAAGRTAIVIFTDGGSAGECPQKTATSLKQEYGDKVQIYGVFLGDREVGWRNLYEVCKLTGGYARAWEEVSSCEQMKQFAWDITVREIMFPYPELFFPHKRADILPSEAIKLEAVANFLHAIPQYVLQIDGHTCFLGDTKENYQLALARAQHVKDALVRMYCVDPRRIEIRSWGEELPRYDNQNPEVRQMNRQANLYLKLPLRNTPYNEKNLHTFGVKAVGDVFITRERYSDTEWAWPDTPPPGADGPPVASPRRK
jgi:outer membrane protein OmpA-like peptidoglycan-associated protein